MVKRSGKSRGHTATAAGVVALALIVGGCFASRDAQRPDILYGQPIEILAGDDDEREGDEIALYLSTLEALVSDDPVRRSDTFGAVRRAAEESATTTAMLNYGLALATPGHSGSDAEAARSLLSSILAAGETLLPEERILARQHLRQVEERLVLDQEGQRLRDQITAARNARNAQTERQVETLQAENARLQAELDEAREKLDAITNIERSIRERDNAANVP